MRLIPKRDPELDYFMIVRDTWRVARWEEQVSADYTCPFGHECSLRPGIHSIAADGVVSPSVVCMGGRETPCDGGFHEFIKLVEWEG